MAEIVITPKGRDALEAGTLVDDEGNRFVVLDFKQPGGDNVVVTFTVPLFCDYVSYLLETAEVARNEAHWTNR
jgi:hypothetical protein